MAIPMTTALVVGFLSLLVWLFLRNFLLQTSPKLPPGPRPLPIVGNLLMMKKYSSIHDFADDLKRQYGPIVTLWMGSKPWIIISGPDILHEAMITKGSVFLGRKQLPSGNIISDGQRTLTSGDGERHRFLRKLLMSGVLSSNVVAGFRPIREKEIDILVDSLKKELQNNGGIVSNFRQLIRFTICNLIVGVLFGRRLTLEEYLDVDYLSAERFQLSTGQLSDFLPWLEWLPIRNPKGKKFQRELRRKMSRTLEPIIQERKEALKEGQTNRATFVDTMLELQDGTAPSPVEVLSSDIVLLCIDILNAGTDTTSLNLEYCIANLVNHPNIQEKVAQEISAVVGERVVNEDDISQMPYLKSVVKEALRRHSPARIAPSRRAFSATKVAGYDIPENTTVLQHLESVSLSPELWEDPLQFRPERFLDETVDFTGTTKITMVPFGVGRRMCPAVNLAFLHAEVVLARLIQAFRWNAAIPGQLLDLSPGGGLTGAMKYPLVSLLQERMIVS